MPLVFPAALFGLALGEAMRATVALPDGHAPEGRSPGHEPDHGSREEFHSGTLGHATDRMPKRGTPADTNCIRSACTSALEIVAGRHRPGAVRHE